MKTTKSVGKRIAAVIFLLLAGGGLYWVFESGLRESERVGVREGKERLVPVEVQEIQTGAIELRRTFSGALEPRAEFVVAPKVAGRLEKLTVNISDEVSRGQVVGELEDDEYVQAVAQAEADLAVARANLSEARSELEIASRELERVVTLRQRGVASESQLDAARANQLAKEVKSEVAQANVSRAGSLLETVKIRRSYTRISAGWSGGAEKRVVAERFVDEGEMVAANTPLLRIVEIAPIIGVIFVTERDYALLQPGQSVALVTDAYPGETFWGNIERIAPVFKETSRQARVEVKIENEDQRLKPGMFIRATVVLQKIADTPLLPEQALTKRGDVTGVFLVNEEGTSVRWHPVEVGIRDGNMVQPLGEGQLRGRIVTLGQQQLKDGSKITIPKKQSASTTSATKEKG
ncbi:MAG: efflux RND transporter periplasmic adaptor subunit [Desulfopila sp.]|jgi:RND family efflux transporter MFP subunit|nr:efflux RND transporter periplasmic adaptor subunit [Desulfopila sp.]